MIDWQEAYFDLVNKVECECVQQGDLVPIWDQFKRMSLTITKLQGHQGAMEAELAKFKALADTLARVLGDIRDGCGQCGGYGTYPEEETVTGKVLWWDCSSPQCRAATEALRKYKEARDAS